MEILPLVGDIEHLVGRPILHTLQNGSQVGGGINGGAVGLHQNHRRNFLFVGFLGHGNHPSTLTENSQATLLQIGNHTGDVGVSIAFTQPLFVVDIQGVVNPLQVGQGDVHNVLPNGTVTATTLLQFKSSGVGLFCKDRVGLFGGCGGIDLLQIRQGKGSICGIFPGVIFVKIGQFRLTLLQFCDDQTHLQTPVAQVNVTDGLEAKEFVQPLQGLTDNGRPEVTDVQRLCHIGSAVVHHNGLAGTDFLDTEALFCPHLFQIVLQEGVRQLQVDKTGHHRIAHRKIALVQLFSHGVCDGDGGALVLLGGRQRAIALILAQIRPVGHGHPTKGSLVTGIYKGLFHFRGDDI